MSKVDPSLVVGWDLFYLLHLGIFMIVYLMPHSHPLSQ